MVFQVRRGSWMIFSPGLFLEEGLGQEANDVMAFNKFAGFVEQEAAVEVAIPSNSHVGLMSDYRISGGGAVSGRSGLGMPLGKIRIRVVVHLDEFDWDFKCSKGCLDFIDNMAGGAVALRSRPASVA